MLFSEHRTLIEALWHKAMFANIDLWDQAIKCLIVHFIWQRFCQDLFSYKTLLIALILISVSSTKCLTKTCRATWLSCFQVLLPFCFNVKGERRMIPGTTFTHLSTTLLTYSLNDQDAQLCHPWIGCSIKITRKLQRLVEDILIGGTACYINKKIRMAQAGLKNKNTKSSCLSYARTRYTVRAPLNTYMNSKQTIEKKIASYT